MSVAPVPSRQRVRRRRYRQKDDSFSPGTMLFIKSVFTIVVVYVMAVLLWGFLTTPE
ncbi:MAG: hypothetical protein AB7O65_13795 [Candidatus Korobacteraceae bacterium]